MKYWILPVDQVIGMTSYRCDERYFEIPRVITDSTKEFGIQVISLMKSTMS